MIVQDPVVRVYSEALLELASENDQLDTVREEMAFLGQLMEQEMDFRVFLESPAVERQNKLKALDKIFRGKLSELTLNFFKVLVEKNRQWSMRRIIRGFAELFLHHKGMVRVYVRTATDIEPDKDLVALKKAIEAKSGQDVLFDHTVEPDLLGGMVIRIGDYQVDGSVRSKLTNIRKSFRRVKVTADQVFED